MTREEALDRNYRAETADYFISQRSLISEIYDYFESKLAEYERLHQALNTIVNPKDAPKNPSLCDLVSSVEADLKRLAEYESDVVARFKGRYTEVGSHLVPCIALPVKSKYLEGRLLQLIIKEVKD